MPGMTDTINNKDGLIDRYLNNELNEVERTAFELMMLEDEQLFVRVQLFDSFKNSLADERAAPSIPRDVLH